MAALICGSLALSACRPKTDQLGSGNSNSDTTTDTSQTGSETSVAIISFYTGTTTQAEGGGSLTLTVGMTKKPDEDTDVSYVVSGTSTAGTDHDLTAGTLTFTAGTTTQTLTFSVTDDSLDEDDETIIITLVPPSGSYPGTNYQHTVTITDDDASPSVDLTSASQSQVESAGTATITATLSTTSGRDVTVPYTVSGTATVSSDHDLSDGTITVSAGSTTGTATVTITDDTLDEADETIIATMATPTNASSGSTTTHTITITDNDSAPTASFSATSQTVAESTTTVTVTATLSAVSAQDITVPFTVSGTAANPADHNLSAGNISITAGSTSGSTTFNLQDDSLNEATETVILTMGTPTNASQGSTTVQTVNITDNDTATVNFSASTQSAAESVGTVTITVNMDIQSSGAVTIPFTVSGTAANPADHNLAAGNITITAGSTSGSTNFTVVSDGYYENDETVIATIGSPSGDGTIAAGSTKVQTVTITNDDSAPGLVINDSSNSEGNTITFTITQSAVSNLDTTVNWASSDSTATAGSDYTANSGTTTISAGSTTATVDISTAMDAASESSEVFYITLTSPSNASIVDSSGRGTITNVAAASLSIDSPSQAGWSGAAYASTPEVTFTITNGSADTAASNVYVSGIASPYSMTSNTCGTSGSTVSVAASSTCAVTIRLTSPGSGTFNDTLLLDYESFSGNSATQVSRALAATGTTKSISVTEIYDTQSDGLGNSNWNDYVKNNGSDVYSSDGTACAGTESNRYQGCVHSGEKLQAVATDLGSCTGLTLTESLGLFNWTCQVVATKATFYTKGLKSTKRLADLLYDNGATRGWNSNQITISDGTYDIYQSTSGAWHANTITALPSNTTAIQPVETLSTASTIYTLDSSRATSGYQINADKIGIVLMGSSVLTYSGNIADNCNSATGETTLADTRCMVSAGSQSYLWIEGRFYGEAGATDGELGVLLHSNTFSVLRDSYSYNQTTTGFQIVSTTRSLLQNIRGYNNGTSGVTLSNSNLNQLLNIDVPNNSGSGLIFSGSDDNLVHNIRGSNNASHGIQLSLGKDNILSQIIATNNGGSGIQLYGSQTNTLTHITAVQNSAEGLDFAENTLTGADSNSLSQIAAVNNGASGARLVNADSNRISNIATANNGAYGVSLEGTSDTNYFTDNLLVGNNTTANCNEGSSGATPGLTASCNNDGSSDSSLNSSVDLSTSLVGKVSANDNSNSSDSSGTGAVGSITDWTEFANDWRAWGTDGSNFPSADNRSDCTSGTCRIWDWRAASLASGSRVILNTSEDGTNQNDTFIHASSCPDGVSGNDTLTDLNSASANTYLANALEIVGDLIGDDDGLCESSETCLYQPNFGAYLGEGDYSSQSCTFADGTVNGVTLYGYPTNGG